MRIDESPPPDGAQADPSRTPNHLDEEGTMTRTDAPAATRRPPRALLPGMAGFSLLVSGSYAALGGVLLSNQVADVDPANKVQIVTLVSSLAFVAAMIVQPLVGALSDRTRGRFGRRAPWLVLGGLIAGAALAVQGNLGTVGSLLVGWIVVTVGLNTVLAPFSAVLPDFLPAERRGRASAANGFGVMIGIALCTTVAGRLADRLPLAYTLAGIAVLVAAVGFSLVIRRPESGPREPFDLGALLRGMWVSPRKHPDFGWAFAARFLFVLGYFAIYTFQLYILTDYVGQSRRAANGTIGFLNVLLVLGALVGVVVGGLWSDRVQRRKPFLYAASAAMALGMLAPLLAPDVVGMSIMSALLGVGFGIYQSVDTALMSQVLPSESAAGKDLGILNLANAIPQAVAPIVGGGLVTLTGGYAALFIVGIVVVILAGVALKGVRRVR